MKGYNKQSKEREKSLKKKLKKVWLHIESASNMLKVSEEELIYYSKCRNIPLRQEGDEILFNAWELHKLIHLLYSDSENLNQDDDE